MNLNVCEVIAWLESVKKLDELIEAKTAERDKLWEMATNMTANSDGMPHAKGTVSDPVGNGAVKLLMLAEEINRIIDTYIDQKKQITDALEKLPPNEFGVLHRYYIKYMTLEQIAEDMGYCRQQIWRFKKKGLKNLENVLECYITHVV